VTGAGRWSVDAWLRDRTESAAEWVDRVSERAA